MDTGLIIAVGLLGAILYGKISDSFRNKYIAEYNAAGKDFEGIWDTCIYKIKGDIIPAECQQFFDETPSAKKFYEQIDTARIESGESLINSGADCVVFVDKTVRITITPDMIILHYPSEMENIIIPYPNAQFITDFLRHTYNNIIGSYQTETAPASKSVLGEAAAGALIAGGAGAIVGAIHAADKNANAKPITKTEYIYSSSPLDTSSRYVINPYANSYIDYIQYEIALNQNRVSFIFSQKAQVDTSSIIPSGVISSVLEKSWGFDGDYQLEERYPEVYRDYACERDCVLNKLADAIYKNRKHLNCNSTKRIMEKIVDWGGYYCSDVSNALYKLKEAGKADNPFLNDGWIFK